MIVITVQAYTKFRIHTINVGNRKLFWVEMIDVQIGLSLTIMPDLVKEEYVVFLKENPAK